MPAETKFNEVETRAGTSESTSSPRNGTPPDKAAPVSETNGGTPPAARGPQQGNGNGGAKRLTQSPIFRIAALVIIVLAVLYGLRYYHYSQTHVSTDDAFVTGDLINISPVISGTLSQLPVAEGDTVKAGQIIARIEDSGPRAAYEQASAAYLAAKSQVPQAQTTYGFEQASVAAQIAQAQAGIAVQREKTAQARQQVGLTSGTVAGQLSQAQAQAAAARAQADNAAAQARNADQAVQTAIAGAAAARAQVQSARATATRAQRDAARFAALYGAGGKVGAVTAQQNDVAQAGAESAQAQLQATGAQANQAQSQISQARAQASAAHATAAAATKQYYAALAQVRIARAGALQVGVQQAGAQTNVQQGGQAQAQLAAAMAAQRQVALRQQQVTTAQAQAAQALAARNSAHVVLADTVIRAPAAGVVVKKSVNVGDGLTAGQSIVTMTLGNSVWITANFKETQLAGVRPGQPVEVAVDAFPGLTFKGKVLTVNAASGNQTALLPADNATGNFTKVVQRIPVKIGLVPAPDGNRDKFATATDIASLRQGMSANPTIDTSDSGK